jgi:hypothetical protein
MSATRRSTPRRSQARNLQVEEICRAWRVFPQMIGYSDKTRPSPAAEAFFLAHVIHTPGPVDRAFRAGDLARPAPRKRSTRATSRSSRCRAPPRRRQGPRRILRLRHHERLAYPQRGARDGRPEPARRPRQAADASEHDAPARPRRGAASTRRRSRRRSPSSSARRTSKRRSAAPSRRRTKGSSSRRGT